MARVKQQQPKPKPDNARLIEASISDGIMAADELQELIERQQSLSTEHEMWVQQQIGKWAAMRENNRAQLKIFTNWPEDRDYVVDPLPSKISEAFADLLFGEDPTFTAAQTADQREKEAQARAQAKIKEAAATAQMTQEAEAQGQKPPTPLPAAPEIPQKNINATQESQEGADENAPPAGAKQPAGDQQLLDNLVEANNLPSELRHAEEVCCSEGEVWWKIYVDVGQIEYPIIEWYSRSHVRPLFRGRKLIAAAFVSEIYREEVGKEWDVFRYVEIQSEGHTRNLLYHGTTVGLGVRVPLDRRPETQLLKDEWNHGLGMLAGRIPNKLGRDRRYGISDYEGVQDLLFSLNEATTIAHENARLTAKKRVAVPREAISDDGTFDASEDVIIVDEPLDDTMGKSSLGANKFSVLEYTFDAEALIAHKEDLASIILTRVGIAQQFMNVGRSSSAQGMASSGTALRVRLIPTTLAAKGKGRFWDDEQPKILLLAQLIDAMPEQQGGFGRGWKMSGEAPVIERSEPLPQDETEEVNRHAIAVAAEVESRRTAIQNLHPDWDDDQVQQELDQIISEIQTFGQPKPATGG